MTKNLKARAIGALIVSAFLFVLPVGALLANQTMTSPVFAMAQEEEDAQEKETVSGNSDDANNVDETDNTEEMLECTCTAHCASKTSYDAKCEACSADYTACEYINPNVVISITAPSGWSNDKAKVSVSVTDALHTGNFEIVTIEAKIGQNGTWTDITEDKYIEVSENCSVYVQVTDQNDKVYSKNRSIKCFDTTSPTLNAAVSNGLLSIVGYDNDSGIKAFYVNGYEFTDFTNSTLNIRLQQFDTGYEYFTIQAMDNAGNMSEVYKTSNPYYDDDTTDDDDKGASTLPADATASAPSSATATVTEHTNTDSNGNTVSTTKQASETSDSGSSDSDSEESETGKEFYTIQTESEKVFYLIIDRDGEEETVYFLTEIDENDLLNTTSTNSETLPKNSAAVESAIPTSDSALSNNNTDSAEVTTDGAISEEESTEETDTEEPEVEEVAEKTDKGGMMTYVIFGIIAAGAIGAWYYLKMVKGKKEDFLDEDDEEDEEEEEIYESDDEGSDGDEFFAMDDEDNSEESESDEDTKEEE